MRGRYTRDKQLMKKLGQIYDEYSKIHSTRKCQHSSNHLLVSERGVRGGSPTVGHLPRLVELLVSL